MASDAGDATHEAIAALQRLVELFGERRRRLASEAGLTETQWQVLEHVDGDDFMPSMFARRRAVSPAAISRVLRQLQDAKLVRAAIADGDARQRTYSLTARGRRTLEGLHARRAEAIEDIWERFDPGELGAFSRFASALADRLEDYLA